MGTGALRGALIVAALLIGLVVMSRAFPDSAPAAGLETSLEQGSGGAQPTDGETPVTPVTTAPPAGPRQVQGVMLQILNGTDESGLAGETQNQLEPFGYQVVEVGNANKTYKRTTLFYRPDAQAQAQQLVTDFFPGAKLEEATNNLNPDVQVTIVVGLDQIT